MKIWGEVFELLFGDRDDTIVDWGETVPSATTAIKRTNNNIPSAVKLMEKLFVMFPS